MPKLTEGATPSPWMVDPAPDCDQLNITTADGSCQIAAVINQLSQDELNPVDWANAHTLALAPFAPRLLDWLQNNAAVLRIAGIVAKSFGATDTAAALEQLAVEAYTFLREAGLSNSPDWAVSQMARRDEHRKGTV